MSCMLVLAGQKELTSATLHRDDPFASKVPKSSKRIGRPRLSTMTCWDVHVQIETATEVA